MSAPTTATVVHWTHGTIYALCGATEGWRTARGQIVSCPLCRLEVELRLRGQKHLRARVIRPAHTS